MMKNAKRVLALLLVVLMLVPMGLSANAASGAAVPTVYCQGQGATLRDAQGNDIYPLYIEIMPIVEECMPLFIDAVTSGNYDAWYNKLYEEVIPLFAGIQLDANGNASDGSHSAWTWDYDSLKGPSDVYYIRDYVFESDWRLDPFDNAAILNDYISAILAKTGSDKINLIGRCEGANIVLAYLSEYGYDKVNCVEFYVQSLYGVDAVSAAFSGNIKLNTASLEAWMSSNINLEDDLLSELLYSFISLAQNTYTLPVLAQVINLFVDKLYGEVMPDLLLNTYGGFPGIWALVNSEDFEDAKQIIFGGREDEYAGMIAKIDNYDVKVRQRVDEIILDGMDAGVKFASFAKYGYVSIPLDATAKELSDGLVTLNRASFGATCAARGAVLPDIYIAQLQDDGKDIYLSPDNNIDASTCLFPDTTWFIKDSAHKNFPDCEHALLEKFLHADGNMTVFTDENYPQYMVYDEATNTILPYAGLSPDEVVDKPMSIKDFCMRFVNAILAYILNFFGFGGLDLEIKL